MDNEDCVEVLVYNKITKEVEVTYLNGKIVLDGLDSTYRVYIACPGQHRGTRGMKVLGAFQMTGNARRNKIPDIDEENKNDR